MIELINPEHYTIRYIISYFKDLNPSIEGFTKLEHIIAVETLDTKALVSSQNKIDRLYLNDAEFFVLESLVPFVNKSLKNDVQNMLSELESTDLVMLNKFNDVAQFASDFSKGLWRKTK